MRGKHSREILDESHRTGDHIRGDSKGEEGRKRARRARGTKSSAAIATGRPSGGLDRGQGGEQSGRRIAPAREREAAGTSASSENGTIWPVLKRRIRRREQRHRSSYARRNPERRVRPRRARLPRGSQPRPRRAPAERYACEQHERGKVEGRLRRRNRERRDWRRRGARETSRRC